ncbi:19145_t:CDS:2, partial [Funneliformis geosporum]
MVNDSDAQNLRIDTSLNINSQLYNMRETSSPISSIGTPISSQIAGSPGSSNSPGSPNSINSDNHISEYFALRTSLGYVSGEYSSRISSDIIEEENLLRESWNSIDANTEMDDQTADQLINNLQSNYWH